MPVLTLSLAVVGAPTVAETMVRERRDVVVVDAVSGVDVDGVVDPAGALLAVPGVSLARDGGPLTSARPLLRGLGGARVVVDVAGVPFVDPAAGIVDAALLPLGLGRVGVDVGAQAGVGGALSLNAVDDTQLQLVAGDLGTLLLRGRASLHHDAGRAVVLVDAGTTRGDFAFLSTDANGAHGLALVRANNDQRRLKLAAIVDGTGPAPPPMGGQLQTKIVGVLSLHEGGVPGFATAPFADLRASTVQAVVGGEVAHVEHGLRLRVFGDVGGSDRRTSRAGDIDVLAALSRRLGVGAGSTVWRDERLQIVVDAAVSGADSTIADVVTRTDRGAMASITTDLDLGIGHLVVATGGSFRVVNDDDNNARSAVDNDATLLPGARLRVGFAHRATDASGAIFVGVAHNSRAPTLDERFAPRGFVGGEPTLRAERITDLEIGGRVEVTSTVGASVVGFASHLDDGIVYVNKSAFEVAPTNTGPARRLGVDVGAHAMPVSFVRIDIAASALSSHVEATSAPLPTAPPVALRTALRLGDDQGHIEAVVVGRGAAPSTIFGTLPSAAYALLGLHVRLPVGERLAVTASIENALDVRTASDAHLLPLPGRLTFIGLEVRP